MRQDQFIARHEAEWQMIEQWFDRLPGARATEGATACADHELPRRYRHLCQQLALARTRGYSPMLIERLAQLTERCHATIYRPANPRWWRAATFLVADFPAEVRAQWVWMLVSAVLLFGPFIAMLVAVQWQPELAYSVFNPEQLSEYEQMYSPDAVQAVDRDSSTDLMMFGHYILNNISIGFRTFASGLLFGLGSVFVLISNGVMFGTVAGHLTEIGYGAPFWRFVVGHSAPELLAIVIAGGAGMRLGFALVAPGQLRRGAALMAAGRIGARLILGVFAMLFFAAFVEAFWSSIESLPDAVKYASGGALWLLIALWLGFGGREQKHAH